MIQQFRLEMVGAAPLLHHSARLSDPLDPATKALKEVTKKRTKTDADHEEIARLEWQGSLYYDKDLGPYLPGANVMATLVNGGKLTKSGAKVQRGVLISTLAAPLSYHGPRDLEGLWADFNFRLMASVQVQRARTMRCRPMFRSWATSLEGQVDDLVISVHELEEIAQRAGAMIGTGDWRPMYGRFEAKVLAL